MIRTSGLGSPTVIVAPCQDSINIYCCSNMSSWPSSTDSSTYAPNKTRLTSLPIPVLRSILTLGEASLKSLLILEHRRAAKSEGLPSPDVRIMEDSVMRTAS